MDMLPDNYGTGAADLQNALDRQRIDGSLTARPHGLPSTGQACADVVNSIISRA